MENVILYISYGWNLREVFRIPKWLKHGGGDERSFSGYKWIFRAGRGVNGVSGLCTWAYFRMEDRIGEIDGVRQYIVPGW
jgi:hypothetical protein